MVLCALLGLAGGCQHFESVRRSTASFAPQRGFVLRTVVLDGNEKRFSVFIPQDYTAQKKWPAILFLHGLFEGGTRGTECLGGGLGPVIARDPQHWPFIVIFPQTSGSWRGIEKDRLAMACLDRAKSELAIDPDRIILAGLSFGGQGVWEIGARHRGTFAALVPVAGNSATDSVPALRDIPIWAFCDSGDVIVPAGNTIEMCRRINAAGGNAQCTQFPGIGHDCWDKAVARSGLVAWMEEQKRQAGFAAADLQPSH
jgi:predicted peptidase